MAISSALSIAVSGLASTQRETDTVALNIAHAQQPGYVRREMTVADYVGTNGTIGLRGTVQRQIDTELQRQLNLATPQTTFADVQNRFAGRLDQLMGTPGTSNSLSGVFAAMNEKLQALSASPDSLTARIDAVNAAKRVALNLNQYSADIQDMRTEAEQAIAEGVGRVNTLLQNIETLNEKIVAQKAAKQDCASLEDARDLSVKELATWVDVQTRENGAGQMTVFTRSGLTLVDSSAITLGFDKQGTLSPDTLWNADASLRGVGTITVETNGAPSVDLLAGGLIRSGKLAAYVDVRDRMLVTAQNQMDALAASLADAMQGKDVAGTAATSGAQAGFDLDLSALQSGNPITLETLDIATGKTKTVTFLRVDSAASLPLSDDATAKAGDTVHGIDFSGGMASVASQIQAALGSAYTVSNPSGSTLRILDDGAAGTIDIKSLTARVTTTAATDGDLGFPLFTDGTGGTLFTDRVDGGLQRRGFSARIAVNDAILQDPSRLVQWQTSPATLAGDPARPNELLSRLANTSFAFGPDTGVVSGQTAFTATIDGFANAVVSHWGMTVSDTQAAKDSQDLIQNNLESRMTESSSVNIDQEMARLIQLQSAYAANARVLQVAREMLDALMRS